MVRAARPRPVTPRLWDKECDELGSPAGTTRVRAAAQRPLPGRRARRPLSRDQHLGRERRPDGPRAIPAEPSELRRRRASRAPSPHRRDRARRLSPQGVWRGVRAAGADRGDGHGREHELRRRADRDRSERVGHRGRDRWRRDERHLCGRPGALARDGCGHREDACLRRNDQHDAVDRCAAHLGRARAGDRHDDRRQERGAAAAGGAEPPVAGSRDRHGYRSVLRGRARGTVQGR